MARMTLFEEYGVNRMNLRYDRSEERYITDDLEPHAESWYLDIRKSLYLAGRNGFVYFNESSRPKVDEYRKSTGSGAEFRKAVERILADGTLDSIDCIHEHDQIRLFHKFKAYWQPLAPVCYVFYGYIGSQFVYLKARVSQNDKLRIDIHPARYAPSKITLK